MPLCTQVGLGPGHFVLDWDRARITAGDAGDFPGTGHFLSQALLQPKPSQPGILFIPGSARLCLTTTAKAITEHSIGLVSI